MDAEGAPDARGAHLSIEDCVVGGMEHAVTEPGHHREPEHDDEARRQADQAETDGEKRETDGEHEARADPVDEEADRHLGRAEAA